MNERHDPLTPDLDSPSQHAMRDLVRNLPSDEPSMAWRSGLNEKLYSVAEQRRRRARWWSFARPMSGVAVAGALAMVFFFRFGGGVPHAATSLEGQLIEVHTESKIMADLAGVAPSLRAARATDDRALENLTQWDETDLDGF